MKSFTLIETLIAIFVFSVLIIGISSLVFVIYRTHTFEWEQSIAIEEARRGLEIMVKEIREAKEGENGAYPIEFAGDKEFVFYSDVDNDGLTERVRYFLGKVEEKNLIQECQSFNRGGSCSVSFSNFFVGNLKEAKLTVSLQGDLGRGNEYVDIFVDGQKISTLCQTGCSYCPGFWEGTQVFDVLSFASDNSLSILVDASDRVDPICPPNNFSLKAKFELYLKYEYQTTELKKGIIKPVGSPPIYPLDQEKISIISQYVRNSPPIFEYFNENGEKIEDYPARLGNTKVMKVFLVVNVDPNRPPTEFQLESYVQLRNLKKQ